MTTVKLELPQATIEDSFTVTDSKELDKSKQICFISSPDLNGFEIIEWDDAIASTVPISEYFPVSHVILNNTDWSLTVVNVGLCVMLYTFQPSNPNTTVKVCDACIILNYSTYFCKSIELLYIHIWFVCCYKVCTI